MAASPLWPFEEQLVVCAKNNIWVSIQEGSNKSTPTTSKSNKKVKHFTPAITGCGKEAFAITAGGITSVRKVPRPKPLQSLPNNAHSRDENVSVVVAEGDVVVVDSVSRFFVDSAVFVDIGVSVGVRCELSGT